MDFAGIRIQVLKPSGEWDSTRQYTAMDEVSRNGSSYMCVFDVTEPGTPPEQDPLHWQIIAKGADTPVFTVTSITGGKRITITVGEEVTVVDLYDGIVSPSGLYPEMTVGDITPDIDTLIDYESKYIIQPTGGDVDIVTGEGQLVSICGNLDENYNPFMADQFVSTGDNLVDPSQYLNIGDNKGYYFPVVKGEWGEYGTSNKNNGYIVIGGTPVAVYYSAQKPTASSYGSACPTHTDHGNTYYLPGDDGWLIVVMSDDIIPACHIVWNNEKDTEAGTFGNTVKDIPAPHTWGWARLVGPEYTVIDETNLRDAKQYPRIGLIMLGDIPESSWAVTTEVGDQTTTYIFKYTLPTATATKMKQYGIWGSNYADLEVDHADGKLVVKSTTITTAAALVTALSGKKFFYELNTVTPVAIDPAVAAALLANVVNNFGLSYFLNNGELATVKASVTEAYHLTGKGRLFDGLARMTMIEGVVAQALNTLNIRHNAFDAKLRTEICQWLVLSAQNNKRMRKALAGLFKREGSGSPITNGITPDFTGEEYYDKTNDKKYESFGNSSPSDWEVMN